MPVSELRRLFDQFSDRPYVVLKSAGHRRRFLQRHVDAGQIVEREAQREGRLMIRPLFREAIRQSRESSGCHAKTEVAALDVARAGAGLFWLTAYHIEVYFYYRWR